MLTEWVLLIVTSLNRRVAMLMTDFRIKPIWTKLLLLRLTDCNTLLADILKLRSSVNNESWHSAIERRGTNEPTADLGGFLGLRLVLVLAYLLFKLLLAVLYPQLQIRLPVLTPLFRLLDHPERPSLRRPRNHRLYILLRLLFPYREVLVSTEFELELSYLLRLLLSLCIKPASTIVVIDAEGLSIF